jgi:hypothetical protein
MLSQACIPATFASQYIRVLSFARFDDTLSVVEKTTDRTHHPYDFSAAVVIYRITFFVAMGHDESCENIYFCRGIAHPEAICEPPAKPS